MCGRGEGDLGVTGALVGLVGTEFPGDPAEVRGLSQAVTDQGVVFGEGAEAVERAGVVFGHGDAVGPAEFLEGRPTDGAFQMYVEMGFREKVEVPHGRKCSGGAYAGGRAFRLALNPAQLGYVARMSEQPELDGLGRTPTSHERLTGRPWDASYRGQRPPWDVGRPHPCVERLAQEGAFYGRVLDVGCGTGENALAIAAHGQVVVAIDVAASAVESGQEKASARGLPVEFLVGDALQLADLGREFDSVLDCGLFHTFDDAERLLYVASLAAVVVPGGTLNLLCFNDTTPDGDGPRRVSQRELRSSFADGWHVLSIEPDRYETQFDDYGAPAWLATIRRT